MGKYACVALLPDAIPGQADFVSREFDSPEDITQLVKELEDSSTGWRVVAFCHVEDLPLLMEDPKL